MYSDQEEPEVEKSTFIKVQLEGIDTKLWANAKTKLMESLQSVLDFKINPADDQTTRDEIHRATKNLFNYANAKLEKATIENHKLSAEIDLLLSEAAKARSESRKIAAEAEAIELGNINKKLRLALGAARLIAKAEGNEEALLFCNEFQRLCEMLQSADVDNNQERSLQA